MADNSEGAARARSGFYFWISVFMLACTLVGFGSSLLTGKFNDVESPLPSYIMLHGIVLTAWFGWLVLQTSLVRANNLAVHRRTGIVGIIIGLLVIVTTPQVFLRTPQRLMSRGLEWGSDMSEFPALGVEGRTFEQFSPMVIFGGVANIVNFALLLGAAIWWRSSSETHKRMMVLASIAIFPPALARISRWPGLGGEDGAFLPIAILAMLVTPLVHDKVTDGRFHKATLKGVALIIVMQLSLQMFAQSDAARTFVHSLA
jgi:hypothetical protein